MSKIKIVKCYSIAEVDVVLSTKNKKYKLLNIQRIEETHADSLLEYLRNPHAKWENPSFTTISYECIFIKKKHKN